MKRYIAVAICSVAAIIWIGFIWSNSAKTGEESGEMSAQVQEVIVEVSEQLNVDPPTTEHTVRKGAHFFEYMLLGALLSADSIFWFSLLGRFGFFGKSLRISLSLPISLSVALIDEFVVQKATEGRGPSFVDVLIDMSGALLAALCAVLILSLIRRALLRRESRALNDF